MKTKRTISIGIFSALALSLPALANPLIVPMAIGLQLITLMGVGAAIEMSNGLPEPTQAVGQKVLSVTLDDGAGNSARVPTTSSADSAASIPEPSASASVPAVTQYSAGSGWHESQNAACSALIAEQIPYSPAGCYGSPANYSYSLVSTSPQCVYHRVVTFASSGALCVENDVSTGYTTQLGCPAGYTLSGGSCVLSNARATDTSKDYLRSAQSFTPYSGEPATPMDQYLSASTIFSTNDTLTINGQSPVGEPRTIRIQNTADGGSKIEAQTQKTDGAGNTYVQNNSYTINGTGTITGASGSSVQGGLTNNGNGSYGYTGSGSSYTPAAGQEGNSSPCGGAGQPKCAIDDSGFSGKDAGGAAAITALNEQAGLRDAKSTEIQNMANPYSTSWIPSLMPGAFEGCQPFQWDVQLNHGPMAGFSSHHEFDLCPQFAFVRIIFGWLFYVMTVIYIARVFFNSNKAA